MRRSLPRAWSYLLLTLVIVLGGVWRGLGPAPMAAPGATGETQARIIQALGGTLCHTGADEPSDPAAPHTPDCAVCPLCATLTAPAVILSAASSLPPPDVVLPARYPGATRPRAPPPRTVTRAQPRAPPPQA